MPKHIAMIMDGNGRWATQRGLERCDGHRAGAQNISTMTEACIKAGVKYLTLYAFSTENWKRPAFEVTYLMNLIPEFCKDKLPEMSEEEQLKLLATDGMLVKRPLVIGEDFVLTGFKENEWKERMINA